MYKRILLATDGSPTSNLALLEASHLVEPGVRLKVITVVVNPAASFPTPYGLGYDAGIVRNAAIENGRDVLERALQQLDEVAVDAEGELIDLTETVSTDIAQAILEEARAWPAELIVLGTHGRSGVKRFFLGSVAEALIRTSPVPVLLVRGPLKGQGAVEIAQEWDEKVMGD